MIGLLQGKIIHCDKNPILIGVGGVGYEVYISEKLIGNIHIDEIVTIYTYTHVRDDAIELFGFSGREDLAMFKLLITVSGIGPKTAMLISGRGADAIKNAIIKSDTDFFTTIPRLGKKNAQKIIIELKNKLGSITELDLSGEELGETGELFDVLMKMGFARNEIIATIKKIDFTNEPIEIRIKKILRLIGQK